MAVRDFANAIDLVVVPIPGEVIERMDSRVYEPGVIPANTYRGQPQDVPVVALRNYLVTRDDVDADVAYGMTKAFWNASDQLKAAHPAASGIDRKHALDGMPVPLHPGAEKYYREIGLLPPPPKQRPTRRRG
jgi:TRAP transporter TAXI family solute receptor